ncbi:MAG: phosphoribosylformylglycinamidine cyclo-ligase [Bdellovibrionota bacterium]|nr:phosphoribosylformylglycinamidine cyclo-ligase [Bdellovibrionota bacterium]
MNYEQAGVNIQAGDLFVKGIGQLVKDTYNENVKAGVGGFASLYDIGNDYLVAGTDGVGTKLLLAKELNQHNTIGQDLVAMCINDILCTGARPLFFLDYLATGKLTPEIHHEVIAGIARACKISSCALIGGETAEMPGCYENSNYDLAGFAVGMVSKAEVINGTQIEPGMSIVAIPSNGFHSNGYSIVRQLLTDEPKSIKEECLIPTRIYTEEVKMALMTKKVFGMAHITGGGLSNISRMNENFQYTIDNLPSLPSHMNYLMKKSGLEIDELGKTFNMGIGFCFVTSDPEELTKLIPDAQVIGNVKTGFGVTYLGNKF